MFKHKSTTTTTTTLNNKKQKNPEILTMEDHSAISTKSLALYGCKLAKELESNIDDAFNKAEEGAKLCDEIAKIFGSAGERLRAGHAYDHQAMQQPRIDHVSNWQEWLANSNGFLAQGIDAVQPVSSAQGMDWLAASAARNNINTNNACSSSSSQRSRRRYELGNSNNF